MEVDGVAWVFGAIATVMVVATVAPMIRVGWWVVRILDFPRMQIGLISAGSAAALLAVCSMWGWTEWRAGALVALGAVAVWELAQMAPYSRLWRQEAPPSLAGAAGAGGRVTVLIVNLDYRNQEHEAMLAMIGGEDPDLLLLVELDEAWEAALAGLQERYPWRVGVTRGRGLGLALWSRLPLSPGDEAGNPEGEAASTGQERKTGEIRHLVLDERPSLWTRFELPDGRMVQFIGVHPTPPGLERTGADDRHDSRIRDAELVKVARLIRADPDAARIVAGDFNDVAWSHTTRLFKRLSGLKDPRIGRGLLNTYHARRPLLRYPLDQVFLSPGFRVIGLERVKAPGSDHFAVRLRAELGAREGVEPSADDGDEREAQEMVEEGRDDAREE